MLMSIEKDILIDSDELIDTIANSSSELKKLLIQRKSNAQLILNLNHIKKNIKFM